MSMPATGFADDPFGAVSDAFRSIVDSQPEAGAALCIYMDGQPVLDLWGGLADPRSSRIWDEDTLGVVFSCTKGIVSILVAQLVEEGLLDYQQPVSTYWPEFAQAGKSDTSVAQLLAHRAGLSAPRADLSRTDILDWDRMVSVLAEQSPLWLPGSSYAYHAITHGWLAGELIRRVTGKSVGEVVSARISKPLGAPFWIGLPEEQLARLTYMHHPLQVGAESAPATKSEDQAWLDKALTLGNALPLGLVDRDDGFNDKHVLAAEIPGAGGVSNARALAKIWSATVCETDGTRLLGDATIETATKVQTEGRPFYHVDPPWPRWGMGFQLDSPARRYLSSYSFGHDGAGGQVAFADPKHRIGFAFVTNLMLDADDTRATDLIGALKTCLPR